MKRPASRADALAGDENQLLGANSTVRRSGRGHADPFGVKRRTSRGIGLGRSRRHLILVPVINNCEYGLDEIVSIAPESLILMEL
jgi:hypothetical protein